MAATRPCMAQLSRLCISSGHGVKSQFSAALFQPILQVRHASKKAVKPLRKDKKKVAEAAKKKRNARATYVQYDMKDATQFSLLDAMRYLKAVEVGRPPASVKYEVAVKLKTAKNGPVVRNRLRLPHPVKTGLRICVICPPESKYAEAARAAGAFLVGEDEIFDAVKDGRIEFDRCICQTDSLPKMNKAGLGRILGPRGLLPSAKTGTVVKHPASVVKDMTSGAEYKEKMGVIRMAVGQLAFTPEEMQSNIRVFMESLKKDLTQMSDRFNKEVVEVVLSSTNGPGFTLSGDFKSSTTAITSKELAIV